MLLLPNELFTYIILVFILLRFIFELVKKKGEKFISFVKIQNKSINKLFQDLNKFIKNVNYWVLFVTAVVTID